MIRFFVNFWMILLSASLFSGCSTLNNKIHQKIVVEGSEITGVAVDVGTVDLKVIAGKGKITGITVANPEGYVIENAFEMNKLRLNLGTFSLIAGRNPIIVKELVVDAPVVNLEMNPKGGSNLNEIRGHINKKIEVAVEKTKKQKKGLDKSEYKPRRLAIRRLVIDDAQFNLRRTDGSTHSGILPDILLNDVGGQEGKTLGSIGTVVVVAMTREMFKEALFNKLHQGLLGLTAQGHGSNVGTFVADKVVGALDHKLALTVEQQEMLKVIIERTVLELNRAVIQGEGPGLLDHGSVFSQIGAISETVQLRLKDNLNEDQMAEVKAFFDKLAADVVEMIKEALLERLSQFLSLTPDQVEQFRPVFREEIEKWGVLFKRFVETNKSLISDYMALKEESSRRIEDLLNEEQMKELAERQGAFADFVRIIFSPEN